MAKMYPNVTGVARLAGGTPASSVTINSPVNMLGYKQVTISSNPGNAAIYYNTNDTTPNTSNARYAGPLKYTYTVLLRAMARANGYTDSSTVLAVYVDKAATPTITVTNKPAGAVVEMRTSNNADTIIYTTDGSNPGFDINTGKPTNGQVYNRATGLTVTQNCTIKAAAVGSGRSLSNVSQPVEVLIGPPDAPQVKVSARKIAQGDPVQVTWDADATASSYVARLYNGETLVEEQEVQSPSAVFALSNAGSFTVKVTGKNAFGEGDASEPVAVESVAPLRVRFLITAIDEETGEEVTTVHDEQYVKYGTPATKPKTPYRRGYTFAGWNKTFANIVEDMDVTAEWDKNTYTVLFYSADGTKRLDRQVIEYNEAATPPELGAPPAGYVFSGWAVVNADEDSNRDYTRVDSNMTLRAVYAWADQELPVVAEITRAERTASGNYAVDVTLSNYPTGTTTALLRVALKTKDGKLVQTSRETVEIGAGSSVNRTVTLKYSGDYVASVAEVEVVGLDGNYRTGGAYSAAVTADVVTLDNFSYTEWSEWSTEMPTASDTVEVEEATQWRSRTKQTTTSTSSSLSGWNATGTSTTTYGNWVQQPGTTSKPTASDTLSITSQSTAYTYYRWCNYYDGKWQQDSIAYGSSSVYHEITLGSPMAANANKFGDQGGRSYDIHGPYGSCGHKREGQSYWWTKSVVTTYQYKTRTKTVTYDFWKWGEWTEWSMDEATATSDREVESRTVYRYRTKVPGAITGNEDTSGTQQHITGSIAVEDNLAGKEATIMVYNATNTDPNEDQIQFIGQTTIGEGNTYDFTFIPKSDPTVETGDFIVSLGVKGSTGLVNVATVKAPHEQFKVTYQYEDADGNVQIVSEQMVDEGGTADIPDAPERESVQFLGWNTSATNVRRDTTVSALFAPRTATVAWVDWVNNNVSLQTVNYGSTLAAPGEAPEATGYTFQGWDAILSGQTTVTDDMVVNAVYEPIQYQVWFTGANGELFKKVMVNHGEVAELPDENPTAEGMIFMGWDTTSGTPWWNVTEDMTVKSIFVWEDTVSDPYPTEEITEGYTDPEGETVFLDTATDGATIRYTTDGSEPNERSTIYVPSRGIQITQPTTIRAMGLVQGMNNSNVTDIEVNVTATNDIGNADAFAIDCAILDPEVPAEPGADVILGNTLLVEGVDYTIEYFDNTEIGTGRAVITGIGNYIGTKEIEFEVIAAPEEQGIDISEATAAEITPQTYTGEAIEPEITLTYEDQTLVKDTDYEVAYENNTEVGTATITVTGIGDYSGTKTIEFQIVAAPEPVNTETLQGAIESATQIAAYAVSEDGTDLEAGTTYITQSEKDAIDAAIAAAQAVLGNGEATQEQVDAAAQALQAAIDAVEPKTAQGQTQPVDKSALQTVIESASQLAAYTVSEDGSGLEAGTIYITQAEKDAIDAAIAAAQTVLDDADATQAQVDAAVTSLAEAVAAVTPKTAEEQGQPVDKTALQEAVDAAQTLVDAYAISEDGAGLEVGTQYVSQSAQDALSSAIAVAQAILDYDGATEAQVKAATDALAAAQQSFEGAVKTVEEPEPEGIEVELIPIYRMYNTKTSEHLWTKSKAEYNACGTGNYKDWKQENIAWYSPNMKAPSSYDQSTQDCFVYVYRLYDKGRTGDHIYLTYGTEMRQYLADGWVVDKGAGFWTLTEGTVVIDRKTIPIYRAYNSKLKRGKHHYTPSKNEYDSICKNHGWKPEGVKFYVVKK